MLTSYLSTYHPIIAPSPENERKYVPTHLPSPITSYHCTISRVTKPERSEKERSTKNYGRATKREGKSEQKKNSLMICFFGDSPHSYIYLSILHTARGQGVGILGVGRLCSLVLWVGSSVVCIRVYLILYKRGG